MNNYQHTLYLVKQNHTVTPAHSGKADEVAPIGKPTDTTCKQKWTRKNKPISRTTQIKVTLGISNGILIYELKWAR